MLQAEADKNIHKSTAFPEWCSDSVASYLKEYADDADNDTIGHVYHLIADGLCK